MLAHPDRLRDRFEALIAPMAYDAFAEAVLDRKPLHVKGDPDRIADVMSLARLGELMSMTSIWTNTSFEMVLDKQRIPADRYCAPTAAVGARPVLRPDPVRVTELIGQGASVVLNDMDALGHGVGETAAAIEWATGGKVQGNLYFSRRERQGFKAHFDTHDVFALHCVGTKVWNVYATRAEWPIAHPTFQFDEADRGDLLFEAEMAPGDLLYLPRGQYHDALAKSDPAVHIAFGATRPIGVDLLSLLRDRAIADPDFRRNLPRPVDADGEKALRDHLARLGQRLAALAGDEATWAAVKGQMADFHYPRHAYDLEGLVAKGAPASAERRYHRNAAPLRLVQKGQKVFLSDGKKGAPVRAGQIPLVQWILARDRFSAPEFAAAFPGMAADRVGQFLSDMTAMGVVSAD